MLLVLLAACPHPVDITLTNVQVAPAMSTGAAWDGPERLDPAAGNVLGVLMGKLDPSGELSGSLKQAAAGLVLPDVAGTLEFRADPDASPVAGPIPEVADSLGPVWAPGVSTLRGVTLGPKSSLRVQLVDQDVGGTDPVGVVVLSAGDLMRAEHLDGALTFPAADATSGQVLSVSVLVVRSKGE